MNLIQIRHPRKEYEGATPLRDVNAVIEKGEFVSIIGPSGTGKTTHRCLNGLEKPTSGQVIMDGVDICDPKADLAAPHRRVGMVFQDYALAHQEPEASVVVLLYAEVGDRVD